MDILETDLHHQGKGGILENQILDDTDHQEEGSITTDLLEILIMIIIRIIAEENLIRLEDLL